MNKIDLWSLITGIAGIGSLLLALWDKFPNFKKFLLPIGCILIGFTFGRVSFLGEKVVLQILSDSQTSGSLIVMLLLFLFAFSCFHYFMRKNETGYAYISIMMILSLIAPSLLLTFSKVSDKINPSDYLKLSSIYEEKREFDTAIKYLEKYSDSAKDLKLKEEIKNKILGLQKSQLESFK